MTNPIDQIRRAHASARPRLDNIAWTNCHHDCGVLLAEIERLQADRVKLNARLVAYNDPDAVLYGLSDEPNDVLAETTAKHWLGELLAVIHRDGGQYEAKHGTVVATQDAIKLYHFLRGDRNCKVCDGLGYSVGVSKRVPCAECNGTGLQ